tara:strand:- start:30 stop:1040 length:1011 start_codon:yes stop_codon:yes gene_type:complete
MAVLKQTEDDPGNTNMAAEAQAMENARRKKAAELEEQRVANARARNTASPVQSQLPARARQVTDLARRGASSIGSKLYNYADDMRNTGLPVSSRDILRQNQMSQAAQQARADAKSGKNTYYQDVYGVDPASSKELGGAIAQDRAGYQKFLQSGAEGLDTRDVGTQGFGGRLKGALGFGPRASDQARASAANLELYRQRKKEQAARTGFMPGPQTGEGTTQGTLQDFGVKIDPATKTREEAPARTPKGEQVRFMRGDNPANTGQFGLGNTFGSLRRKKDKPAGADSIDPALAREFKPDVNPTGSAPSPAAIEAQRQKAARADKERAKTKTTQTTLDV